MRVSMMRMSLASGRKIGKSREDGIIKEFILDILMKMKLMIEMLRKKGLF
jgi:hypothetical protein